MPDKQHLADVHVYYGVEVNFGDGSLGDKIRWTCRCGAQGRWRHYSDSNQAAWSWYNHFYRAAGIPQIKAVALFNPFHLNHTQQVWGERAGEIQVEHYYNRAVPDHDKYPWGKLEKEANNG